MSSGMDHTNTDANWFSVTLAIDIQQTFREDAERVCVWGSDKALNQALQSYFSDSGC